MTVIKLSFLIFTLFFSLSLKADYQYDLAVKEGHKIHVLTIDPKEYKASLVAAHDQVFGREKIGEIAKRENAQIAINAGFFEIGDNQDGRPCGTAINGIELYGFRTTKHACLVKNEDNYSIEIVAPSLEIKFGKEIIIPKKFNRFAKGKGIFYFNRNWGPTTLSAYSDRKEIIIGADSKIIDLSMHGNNKIPDGGCVISFPIDYDLAEIKIGRKGDFLWTPNYFLKAGNFVIMGIPALIIDNEIQENLAQENLSNEAKHARTALGIKEDGKIIVVVVEHFYNKNPTTLDFSEIKKIIDRKNLALSDLKVGDLKKVIHSDSNTEGKPIGLTLRQLADFMKERGCTRAINLDGGGSSALYVDGRYINESYGDKDEAEGQKLVRPVADAIIFKKI